MLLLAAIVVAGSGCRGEGMTGVNLDGLPAGIEVRLYVEPSVVAPHESFSVGLTIRNTTAGTLVIYSNDTCEVLPGVYLNGMRQPFLGTGFGCYDMEWATYYLPGETKTRTWTVKATLDADVTGVGVDTVPRLGDYEFRVRFNTASTKQPMVKRMLYVR